MNLLIRNPIIVNSNETFQADILIADGKIVFIGQNIEIKNSNYFEIMADGLYALPGGIDPHVHMELPTPAGNSSDDFRSGSIAALSGGTTTILDFVTPSRNQSLIDAFHQRKKEAENSLIDFRLHMGISEYNPKVAKEIKTCIQQLGITSFKAYLAYKNTIGIDYTSLRKLMKHLSSHNAILLIHCEDGDEIERLQRKYIESSRTSPLYHAKSRPEKTESDAVAKVLQLVKSTGCRTYLVHISAKRSIQLIAEFKKDSLIYAETCPQYLVLPRKKYYIALPGSLKYVFSPPIRNVKSQQELWSNISLGNIDVISTDHCPFNTFGQKDLGIKDFTRIPNGAGGIEYRIPLLYTYGVLENKITLQHLVDLTSTKAAKIFGLYPKKGLIAVGSEADVVLWNFNTERRIKLKNQVQRCDSNIYLKKRIVGKPEYVICKGKIAFKNGKLQDSKLRGTLL